MAGISITLAGNFQKLDELKGKADKAAKSIKESFSKVGNSAAFKGVAAGATAAFAAITAATAKAIGKGGELSDMMARTGASGKNLLILERAFINAGMAGDRVPLVLNKMQQALAGTNDEGELTSRAFQKLGLSIEELQALDPADAFKKTSQAIAALPDPAQRAAAAMEIFGKAGGELLVVMNDTNAFATAREQIGSLADSLPGKAGEFDTVADAMADFGTKAEQLGTQIAIGLLPVLTSMVDMLNNLDFGKLPSITDFRLQNPFSRDGLKNPLTVSQEYLTPDRGEAEQKAADWASDDPMHGKSKTEMDAARLEAQNADFWSRKEQEKQDAIAKRAEAERAAAEKQAEADRKKAEATKESRAAAAEEYRLENAILAARLKGDADRLAKLEREKAIREEMKRLETAGFTAEEARKPAVAKVDAAKKANDAETKRQAATDEKRRIQEILAGKVNDARERIESREYQSSIGEVSSMQRIGGGGGAVSSGLDYQRQTSDLLRELNANVRQLIEVSRQPIEG